MSPNQIFFTEFFFWKDLTNFRYWKKTLKLRILRSLTRLFIFWLAWGGHYLVKKCFFPIDALVVWCPTWSKNLGWSLLLMAWLANVWQMPAKMHFCKFVWIECMYIISLLGSKLKEYWQWQTYVWANKKPSMLFKEKYKDKNVGKNQQTSHRKGAFALLSTEGSCLTRLLVLEKNRIRQISH